MRRLLFPHKLFPALSGNARTAAIAWLVVLLAAAAIMFMATLRPAAAASLNPLDLIAPAGQPVGLLMALGTITGAALIGCVGALMFIGAGGHPRRRRV